MGFQMSKSSDAVKKWRKKVKEVIIGSMGGKCQVCGYDRCPTALEVHHVDPLSKDFNIGSVYVSCKSWNVIYEELKKCILLCGNCHREIHYGITDIPSEYTKFDSTIADRLRSVGSIVAESSISDNRRQIISDTRKVRAAKKSERDKMKRVRAASKEREIKRRVSLLTSSSIGFHVRGWRKEASVLLGISEQKTVAWMKKHMKDFYEEKCYKRRVS